MTITQIISLALLGGILPALLWLWFWLREDDERPEPPSLLVRTFLAGMCAVVIVLPFQELANNIWPGLGFPAILAWATIEEIFIFAAAYVGGLSTQDDNEPLDPLIYMITAALGFTALENALYIADALSGQHIAVTAILTGNLRFIGASLLHTVSSGTIGLALALSFYKPFWKKVVCFALGFGLAVFFHTAFNLSILDETNLGALKTFAVVWAGAALLILLFEKVKTITPAT